MIAVSLKDGEGLVDLFLRKGADVNAKSEWQPLPIASMFSLFTFLYRFQWSSRYLHPA
jgi:hypothetical protein